MDTTDSSIDELEPPVSMRLTDDPEQLVFPFFDLPAELRECIYDYSLVPDSTFRLLCKENKNDEQVAEQIEHAAPPLPPLVQVAPPHPTSTIQQQQQQQQSAIIDLPERADPPQIAPSLRSSVRYRGNVNLLLCSKAIRHEYENRAKLAMTLVLKDNENYAFQLIHLPEQVKAVYQAELHIILFCHHCIIHPHADDRSCQAALEIVHHRPWIEDLLEQLTNLRSFTIQAYLCYDKRSQESKEKLPCEPLVKRKLNLLYSLPKLQSLTLYKYDFNVKPNLDGPKVVMHEWEAPRQKVNEVTAEAIPPTEPEQCAKKPS